MVRFYRDTAKDLYDSGRTKRNPYVARAAEIARYTIPYIAPENENDSGDDSRAVFSTAHTSNLGGRLTHNFAARLGITLLPPNVSHFRFEPDLIEVALETIRRGAPDPFFDGSVELLWTARLRMLERFTLQGLESIGFRVALNEALIRLAIAGNTCLFLDYGHGRARNIPLHRYITERDASENLLLAVIKESVSEAVLDERGQRAVARHRAKKNETKKNEPQHLDIYTKLVREDDFFVVSQFVEDEEIEDGAVMPGMRARYPIDDCPFLFPSMRMIAGEHYGRPWWEDFFWDLQDSGVIHRALVEGAKVAARAIPLVDPGGMTSMQDVTRARNLEPVVGRKKDVEFLTVDKYADFAVAQAVNGQIEQNLAPMFLLTRPLIRDAERVTVEEVRLMQQESEVALGGLFSVLSETLSKPAIRVQLAQVQRQGRATVNQKLIIPKIVTGLEAIGRTSEMQRLDAALSLMQKFVPPEMVARVISSERLMHQIFLAAGLDPNVSLLDPEEQGEQEESNQIGEVIRRGAPQLVGAIAKGLIPPAAQPAAEAAQQQ